MIRSRQAGTALMFAAATALLTCTPQTSVAHADSSDGPLNALMMGGTGMPTPSQAWRDSIIEAYINPATGGDYTLVMVATPESFASPSVPDGVVKLLEAIDAQVAAHPDEPFVVSGYSQSAMISIMAKAHLAELAASGQPIPDVTFLLLGSSSRPNGGEVSRFEGLAIPGVGGAFPGAEPTDLGIPTIDISNQYDFFSDFPQYPINLIADLNAVFGIIYAHASYGDGPLTNIPAVWPPSEPMSGPYVDEYVLGSSDIVKQVEGDTTFYLIPSTTLPLLGPLMTLGVPQSVLDIVQPALQVIVEAGYDRSVPFGEPTPVQLIPTLDPLTFGIELTRAVVQGADNAFGLFGTHLPGYAELDDLLAQALAWSQETIGESYHDAVAQFNADFNPFTAFFALEAPIGLAIQDVLDATGIQEFLIDPILGIIGPLGGAFTS
ncbi:PE-PPE domain-containing protein [[Mycobacterium] kokjensenii]|uniref:PE-PPE domain-containing protein n=1 Tax=[Mycobacterium] kokjensenii TaxID=3064287 RepID=A0ABM9LR05_9MYCO|nr:PE-PPE domain-containing protein [Mycolicibacter sp. MU0083]CAJ1503283.1 PE-PPE domain-containing protein [Mycolicibacter sp. MU0083]